MTAARLPIKTCLGFGIGTVGMSIMLNAVTSYYPAFMSTVLGQSPEVAGYLMMGAKLYDAVADVIIGSMSDKSRSRWGRRRPFMLAGALLSAISFLMLFAPPALSQSALIAYMIAAQVIYSTAYSLFAVPYMALPAELTAGFGERTRLLSFRTVFVSIGQMLATAGTAAIVKAGGAGASAYATMGLVMALVIFGAMTATVLSVPTTHGEERKEGDAPALSLARQIALMGRNRPYRLLLGAKVFQFLAFASMGSTGLLFMLNVLGLGYDGQILLTAVQNIATALSMPLWVRTGASMGKRKTYLIGVFLFCATALSWLLVGHGVSTAGIVLRGIGSGFGSGALILMSISMLGDTMVYDRAITGMAREGLLSSTVAVVEKASFALGVAVLGIFLRMAHYIPTTGGKLVAQPDSAVLALSMGYTAIPAAMFIANGVFLWLYDLDEAKLAQAQAA
ncbi:MFS transporter [Novosphingobium umbonatum]|uniref:MFS transporter n=1 Tax=Novosphingobium umbonatum TaxID=1908524 RepID=A0A3S2VFN4_9SPHN|nr:MFS transporter [Novosphingobium umbonatum]RVU06944.1 MFS transporter [Novosphingobium umbonatum]